MSAILLEIDEATTHLLRHLNEMSAEDRIILCNCNDPVAEVKLLPGARRASR